MRLPGRPTPRAIAIAAAGASVALTVALSFGPVVRHELAAQASKRHLVVDVAAVRPAWMGVRLLDVTIRAEGVSGVEVHAPEVRVGLSWNLGVREVLVHSPRLSAHGQEDDLRAQVAAWRTRSEPPSVGSVHRAGPALVFDDLSVRWEEMAGAAPKVEASRASGQIASGQGRMVFGELRARMAGMAVSASDGSIRWGTAGVLEQAHAASVTVERSLGQGPVDSAARPDKSSPTPPSAALPPASPGALPSSPRASAASVGRVRKRPIPDDSSPASSALLPLPDLKATRARTTLAARLASERLAEGADVRVDALTWKVSRPDEATALTIGPGPFVVKRSPNAVELRFSTDARDGRTPLAFGLALPLGEGDVAVTVDGGPLSLDLLGIHEGALGLVNVAQATLTGRARIALASDASALTFDLEGSTHGLAIRNARLAQDVVRGVDLDVRARGVLTTPADLRLDEAAVKLGAAELSASGVLRQADDHIEGGLRFEVPTVACNALHESFPAALLPALDGAHIGGTFGASGRLAFDSRALDDMALDYDVHDRCQFADVPPDLSRDRFTQAFVHKVYLPDGTIGDHTTGPGTPNWTALEDISPYMQVAVLTTEDGAFLRHHGFNRAAIRASIIANLKAGRFVRGASTITMQLAKNLFLSRDKTLARKLEEVVLAEYLEQTFSKEELMELYLNVIEFGPAVYGITSAADYYFGRTPAELNLAECLFLASVLPSPLRYGALRDAGELSDDRRRGLHSLMEIAHRNGRINDNELAEAEAQTIEFWRGGGDRPPPRPNVAPRVRLDGDPDDTTVIPTSLDDDPR
jgi:hypothetical protein